MCAAQIFREYSGYFLLLGRFGVCPGISGYLDYAQVMRVFMVYPGYLGNFQVISLFRVYPGHSGYAQVI